MKAGGVAQYLRGRTGQRASDQGGCARTRPVPACRERVTVVISTSGVLGLFSGERSKRRTAARETGATAALGASDGTEKATTNAVMEANMTERENLL